MYREQNEWYLLSHGFRPGGGYFIHYDRRIIVSDRVVEDFEPVKLSLHVESLDEGSISFILSAPPAAGIPEDIMRQLNWEGEKAILILK